MTYDNPSCKIKFVNYPNVKTCSTDPRTPSRDYSFIYGYRNACGLAVGPYTHELVQALGFSNEH